MGLDVSLIASQTLAPRLLASRAAMPPTSPVAPKTMTLLYVGHICRCLLFFEMAHDVLKFNNVHIYHKTVTKGNDDSKARGAEEG